MQRLEEVLSAEPTVRDAADAEPLGTARGEIEFRNVTFAYPGREREPALREVSLSVAAGSTLGVVGHTGSGKSSLAMLLPRLWDPTAGEILIDGRDARRVPVRELRRLIRVVPQDPFLFSTTVRANIAFAVDQVPDEEIRRVARLVGIDQEVERFPAGYETVVGERGITLSGGQKQRLALARALLAPAPVLVLDDPLSSVDAETEARIVRALESEQRGRTTQIVISHRISAVQNADRIVVLRRGRIVEAGRHEELLRRGGLYAALFRQQRLEEEIAAL
jgi:ATP-binding cassette subfamily B protein